MATYALGDLHGRLDLYKAVKEYIKPEDKVICVGDCGDRGPEPWETIKAVYNDPQFVYLMGNHDHLLMKAMYQYSGQEPSFYVNPWNGVVENGGGKTLQGWIDEGADMTWAEKLKHLPLRYFHQAEDGYDICVCHGGFTPIVDIHEYLSVSDIIWDRNHLKDGWPSGKELEKSIIVFGHTPTELIDKKCNDEVIYLANGHKIDIDCGAVWTGKICLFDLDTFDENYIIGKPMTV